jgi:DNA-binding CsgD family transcriptional regulator
VEGSPPPFVSRLWGVSWWGKRAAGVVDRPAMQDTLSAREMQIARLAAQGLSNREIGQRLFLSPRTLGSHLYRIFPKLNITSRGRLASCLDGV